MKRLFPLLSMVMILAVATNLPAAKRPNIIVFLVDDYDKHEASLYGGKVLTPNLERLAREGITFNNAHVTSTVCTPSRYTFLTGRYAGSSYYPEYLELFPPGQQALPAFNVGLEPDNMNVGAVLAKNGYAAGFVGKFHVGPSLSEPDFRRKYRLHDVQKNAPFTEGLNRQQFENEKQFRRAVRDYGFTWAKNIYWDNTKAPFQRLPRRLWNSSRNIRRSRFTCTTVPPCCTGPMAGGTSRSPTRRSPARESSGRTWMPCLRAHP